MAETIYKLIDIYKKIVHSDSVTTFPLNVLFTKCAINSKLTEESILNAFKANILPITVSP